MDEKDIIQAYNNGLNAVVTLVQDITGQSLSEGILVNVAYSLYRRLEEPVGQIKQLVTN